MGKENKDTTAESRIKQAKKTVLEILNNWMFIVAEIPIVKEESIPYELRRKIKKVRENSHQAVTNYISGVERNIGKKDNSNNAQSACQANRRVIGLIYFASLLYQDFSVSEADLVQFREDIDRVIYYNERLSEALQGDKKRLLLEYSNSELRRQAILQALIEEDMPRAQRVLLGAMREALEKSAGKQSAEVN